MIGNSIKQLIPFPLYEKIKGSVLWIKISVKKQIFIIS